MIGLMFIMQLYHTIIVAVHHGSIALNLVHIHHTGICGTSAHHASTHQAPPHHRSHHASVSHRVRTFLPDGM